MGFLRTPLPVKLFVGMLAQDTDIFQDCLRRLSDAWGPIDLESPLLPWTHTDYYEEEMGAGLSRKFYFFERLMDPGELPAAKLLSIEMERTFSRTNCRGTLRRLNLDPGYVTEAKVVLATTKDFAHRVYIGQGIFAESTLRYDGRARLFLPLEHTYPDFRSPAVRALFLDARELLRRGLPARETKP